MVSALILGIIRIYNNKLYTAYDSLRLRSIESNLFKLQWAIQVQEENNWSNPFAVTEKIQDVIEGISTTFAVGRDLKIMKRENEDTLYLLLKVITTYDKYGDSPDGVKKFNTEDQQAFRKLGSDLKKVGWEMGVGYGENNDKFKKAVNNLYNFQKEQ